MRRSIVHVLAPGLALLAGASARAQGPDLDSILRFETGTQRGRLNGWGGGPAETIHFDSSIVHGGKGAARLQRDAKSPQNFTTIGKQLPIDFGGQSVELRGFLRTKDVTDMAGLWLREDGPGGILQFDNMSNRGLRGTTDWTEYVIRLPLNPNAGALLFGVLVVGEGTVWADDLQLLVDGRPLAQASKRTIPLTVLGGDHEFDAGSRITVTSLTANQTENLAVLGMVWGFFKYHHPDVAAGKLHWDYELFRVLPKVLAASDRNARNRVLAEWIDSVGTPERCGPCAQPPRDVHLLPRIDWIRDTAQLGRELSRRLQTVYANRFAGREQFYVSQTNTVGNPAFRSESTIPSARPPDAGFRILAAYRFWNIIEYWFPYRDQIDGDWHATLREVLPRIVQAHSWDAYRLELLAFIARIQDTHSHPGAAIDVRPPRGQCSWPVAIRFVEGRPVVVGFTDEAPQSGTSFDIGDVVEKIDGRPVDSLVTAWIPYYAASNHARRLSDMAHFLSRGECGESSAAIMRRGVRRTLSVARVAGGPRSKPHDRAGSTFQLLSPEIAYLKLSSVRMQDIPGYLEQASGTRGLVIDIRNYPSDFVVFALGGHLVDKPTPFARVTVGRLDNPGAFTWTAAPVELQPISPRYGGKVAILVDEVSISNSEYTAMALRASPNAVVVGSTTAGADGNVSAIPLPGNLQTSISGIGVFYPDKRPTQRVGIVPDIVATPTIAGIREGRDEVLEAALRHLLGRGADEQLIRRMSARP